MRRNVICTVTYSILFETVHIMIEVKHFQLLHYRLVQFVETSVGSIRMQESEVGTRTLFLKVLAVLEKSIRVLPVLELQLGLSRIYSHASSNEIFLSVQR